MDKIGKIQTSASETGYFRFGKEGAQPFVLLPGLGIKSVLDSAGFVEKAYRSIGEVYDCYLFEPGTELKDNVTVKDLAEDIRDALNVLHLENIVLMGVSMGGMIAQELTVCQPDKISRLILCSTTDRLSDTSKEIVGNWKTLAEKKDGIALCKAFSEAVYTKEFVERYRDAFEAMGKMVTPTEFERFVRLVSAVDSFDASKEADTISCPVFVIGGKEDVIFTPEMQSMLAGRKNAELYLYDYYAHAVYDEAPDIKERILNWCKG